MRVCVERAFGMLKGRFRCLLKCLRHKVNMCDIVILTCFILHNWLLSKSDYLDDIIDNEDNEADDVPSNVDDDDDDIFDDEELDRRTRDNITRSLGKVKRDELMSFMKKKGWPEKSRRNLEGYDDFE